MSALLYSLRDGTLRARIADTTSYFNSRPTIIDEALSVALEHVEYCHGKRIMCTDIAEAIGRPEVSDFHREPMRRRNVIVAALAAEWIRLQRR